MQEKIKCETLYPEMYYRVQPFILSACDQIDQCGYGVSMKEAVTQMSDQIYQNVCRMYPDMAAYCGMGKMSAGESASAESAEAARYNGRGLLGDVLDIWLLNELFGRRRRW